MHHVDTSVKIIELSFNPELTVTSYLLLFEITIVSKIKRLDYKGTMVSTFVMLMTIKFCMHSIEFGFSFDEKMI